MSVAQLKPVAVNWTGIGNWLLPIDMLQSYHTVFKKRTLQISHLVLFPLQPVLDPKTSSTFLQNCPLKIRGKNFSEFEAWPKIHKSI